jgi:hypothetical protein
MRLGVIPEGIIDRIALVSGKLPIPLLETFWGIALGSTVITGTRLGVFESLAKNKKTAEEVAKDVKCDAQAMKTLLNALNGFGYLRRRKGVYSLTKKAGKWLTTESHSSMRDAILFMGELFNILGDIETAVKSGKTEDFQLEVDMVCIVLPFAVNMHRCRLWFSIYQVQLNRVKA